MIRFIEVEGHRTKPITARDVRGRKLSDFDIMCFGPGSMPAHGRAAGDGGAARIDEFVRSGGGLILLCESIALLEERLGILPMACLRLRSTCAWALGQDAITPHSSSVIIEMETAGEEHPITRNFPSRCRFLHEAFGTMRVIEDPALFSNAQVRVSVLARCVKTGDVVMLAAEYGRGRIFALSVWPGDLEQIDPARASIPAGYFESEVMGNAIEWAAAGAKPFGKSRGSIETLRAVAGGLWPAMVIYGLLVAFVLWLRRAVKSRKQRPNRKRGIVCSMQAPDRSGQAELSALSCRSPRPGRTSRL
jgi:hypothetical protein